MARTTLVDIKLGQLGGLGWTSRNGIHRRGDLYRDTSTLVSPGINVESGTSPWVASAISGFTNASTLAAVTGDAPPGGGSNSVSTVANGSAADQMVYVPIPGTVGSGTAYTLTFWIKLASGSGVGTMQWVFGSQATSGDRSSATSQTITSSWVQKTINWTPSANYSDPVLAIATWGTVAVTARMDLVYVTPSLSIDEFAPFIGGGYYP